MVQTGDRSGRIYPPGPSRMTETERILMGAIRATPAEPAVCVTPWIVAIGGLCLLAFGVWMGVSI